jgi:hypothetical protein
MVEAFDDGLKPAILEEAGKEGGSAAARFFAIYDLRQQVYRYASNRTLLSVTRVQLGTDYELLREVAEAVYGQEELDVKLEGRLMAKGPVSTP